MWHTQREREKECQEETHTNCGAGSEMSSSVKYQRDMCGKLGERRTFLCVALSNIIKKFSPGFDNKQKFNYFASQRQPRARSGGN